MQCSHNAGLIAPFGGNWSNDYPFIHDYPDMILVNIKQIAATDNTPFGQFPIESEIRYTDVEKDGALSPYLPFRANAYYSVGNPNGNGFLYVHSRLQKPDSKGQNRAVDIYACM